MLRLTLLLLSVCCINLTHAQSTEFATSRQAYHNLNKGNPDESLPIYDILDSLNKKNHFSAICPANGGPAILLRNEGVSVNLTPPLTATHPWEPTIWVWNVNNNSWKGICPGDSVYFIYSNDSEDRASCAPELDLPPWPSISTNNPWWHDVESDGIISKGSAYTRLGADNVFDKPLILVEGFDFAPGGNQDEHRHGGFGWESIWACNISQTPGTANYPILLDSLYNCGYDIVFVDFAEGTSSIETKSILVQEIIQLCNEYKTSENSLIVIGASMGGVVARHSLCMMEESGQDHCTRLYISIDAPHRGANISPGLQGIVKLFAVLSSEAAIFDNGMNSPAAKQLLNFSFSGTEEHDAAMTMLDDIGMPEKCINISISNAHPDIGIEMNNAPILNWTHSFPIIGSGHLLANRHPINNGWAQAASICVPVDFNPFNGEPMWYSDEEYGYYGTIDYDVIPSSVGRHMELLVNAINASGVITIETDDYQPSTGFISYESALNINEDGYNPFDKWHCATQWDAPEEHVALSYLHRKLIMDNIFKSEDMAPPFLSYGTAEIEYSYGSENPTATWIGNTSINMGGALYVGDNYSSIENSTIVKTLPCASRINLNTGGRLMIGAPMNDNECKLIIGTNSTLNTNGNCDFRILSGDKLIIENGGELILDNSVLEIESEGTLRIQAGGVVIMRNGGKILLGGSSAAIILNGTLRVEEGAASEIVSTGNSFSQVLISSNTSKIIVNAFCKLKIYGNDNLILDIEPQNQLKLWGSGRLSLVSTLIQIAATSQVNQSLKTQIVDCDVYGSENGLFNSTNRLKIDNTIWDRVMIKGETDESSGFRVVDSYFFDATISLENTGFHIEHNTFENVIFFTDDAVGTSNFNHNNMIGSTEELTPCFNAIAGEHIILNKNVFTNGGTAVRLAQLECTMSCNSFQGWEFAVALIGDVALKMNPLNGGGYNYFNDNGTHISFEYALQPALDNGRNSFSNYSISCFEGLINTGGLVEWEINGNYWLPTSLGTPTGGELLGTDLFLSSSGFALDPVGVLVINPESFIQSCPDIPITSDTGKSLSYFNTIYDISGREINTSVLNLSSLENEILLRNNLLILNQK